MFSRFYELARVGVPLLVALATVACDSPANPTPRVNPTPAPEPTVTSLGISGTPSFTSLGQSVQLAAKATMSDGSVRDVTTLANWQTANASVATVSAGGLVSPAPGLAHARSQQATKLSVPP